MVKVLFVCMGNICRSPTAEGVFRSKVSEAGLEDKIHIDSAGTHAYHVGEDMNNQDDLLSICPQGLEGKIHLFLKFASNTSTSEVPDPYYGGGKGFETVLDLVENAADGLIAHLQKNHSL